MRDQVELVARLRSAGMRATPQRLAIAAELFGNRTHPTVESLHAAALAHLPSISLKTVYEAVREFESLGEVRLLELGTGCVRVDPNVETNHHHLVCSDCGSVRDLDIAAAGNLLRNTALDFAIEAVEVIVRGRCEQCSSTNNKKKRKTNA